jgi:hypothetical protein
VSNEITRAIYWDSSPVLSAFFRDRHSDEASRARARIGGAFSFHV